jgi:hypothetical protein
MMKTIRFLSIVLVFMLMASCSETYLEEDPPNLLTSQLILQDYDGFEALLNGMYNIARHARWQSEKIENAINGVDNFTSNRRRSKIFWQWGSLNSPDDKDLKETWGWLYEIIYSANNIISYAENEDVDWTGGPASPEENKNRIVAEARAVRAWAYRRLAWSWGDVPITTDLVTTIVTDWERAPVNRVRAQMIADFKWAQQYVPTEASMQGRITKGAVQTFLAETYLTVGKPDSALYWADQVINNPAYQLVTERYGVFQDDPTGSPFGDMYKHTPDEGNQNREDGNTEALWVWQFKLYDPLDGQGHEMSRAITGEYNLIRQDNLSLQFTYARGGRGKSYFTPTRWWVLSYEDQDDRAQNYILRKFFTLKNAEENHPGNGADELPDETYAYGDTIWLDWSEENDITEDNYKVNNFPFSRKGEGTDPNDMAADFAWSDQIYLRLADTYLLKAEALFKLDRPGEAAAVINVIRERSNATPISAGDVTLDFILDERSRELIVEEDRRYTLLRTNKWVERTSLHNHFGGDLITERDTLFPIPQTVIDANLTGPFPQNPGF